MSWCERKLSEKTWIKPTNNQYGGKSYLFMCFHKSVHTTQVGVGFVSPDVCHIGSWVTQIKVLTSHIYVLTHIDVYSSTNHNLWQCQKPSRRYASHKHSFKPQPGRDGHFCLYTNYTETWTDKKLKFTWRLISDWDSRLMKPFKF